MSKLKKTFTRLLSSILCLVMTCELLPITSMAALKEAEKKAVLSSPNSEVAGSKSEEDWETAFPYGTFIFEHSELSLNEGGEEGTVVVRRLGGNVGKAEVNIDIIPVVAENNDGSTTNTMAASYYDYSLSVEDPLPITDYQKFGRPEQPLEARVPAKVLVDSENSVADGKNEAGEPVMGHTVLTLNRKADAYLWQAQDSSGMWKDAGTEATLDVDNDALALGDFRCIYRIGKADYCSESFLGEVYQREPETVEPVPEDLILNPEKTYTVVDPEAAGIEPLGAYGVTLVFAEGETEKTLKFAPVDDSEHESVELLAVQITSCVGGELYDTANSLTVVIQDNEKQEPSFFGFDVTETTVDKATGTLRLYVSRTGALQYMTTIDYCTVDGTAKAGEDYTETKGSLTFAVDMDRSYIEIPLIDNGEKLDEKDALSFSVKLSNPKGGGPDSAIVKGKDTAVVNLYNSGTSDTPNLPSMLYTPEADDATGITVETKGGLASGSASEIKADIVKEKLPEPVTATITPDGEVQASGLATYTLNFGSGYKGQFRDKAQIETSGSPIDSNNPQYGIDNAENYPHNNWNAFGNDTAHIRDNSKLAGSVGWKKHNIWAYKDLGNDFGQKFTDLDVDFYSWSEYNASNKQTFSGPEGGICRYNSNHNRIYWNDMFPNGIRHHSRVPKSYNNIPYDTGEIGLGVTIRDVNWPHEKLTTAWGWIGVEKATATRRKLDQPLDVVMECADTGVIDSKYFMPGVKLVSGGAKDSMVYIGSTLEFQEPMMSTYELDKVNLVRGSDYAPINAASRNNNQLRIEVISREAGTTFGNVSDPNRGPTQIRTNDGLILAGELHRRQSFTINLLPSVPRKLDENGNPTRVADMDRAGEARDMFLASNGNRRTVKIRYKEAMNGPETQPKETEVALKTSVYWDQSVPKLKIGDGRLEDVTAINFGLSKEDVIVVDGKSYGGDQWIPISPTMFGIHKLEFNYYQKDYLTAESDMAVTITNTDRYLDANGNGMLDGHLDNMGIFILDAVNGVKDEKIDRIQDGDYAIREFAPVFRDGKPIEQILKITYTMIPRCLVLPKGAEDSDRAQILPAFVSTVTDEDKRSQYSEDELGFRFVNSGQCSEKTYSGDNKLMYGAEASEVQNVDVPLGGNMNQPKASYSYDRYYKGQFQEHRDICYINPDEWDEKNPTKEGSWTPTVHYLRKDWTPNYSGNMLYQFHEPSKFSIVDPNYGAGMPVSNFGLTGEDATVATPGDWVQQTNSYLGSFNVLDTVALCSRSQKDENGKIWTTENIHSTYDYVPNSASALGEVIQSGEHTIMVDNVSRVGFKSIPDSDNLAFTEPGQGEDANGAAGDSGNSENKMKELNLDADIKLPPLSVGLFDTVTVITSGDSVGFSIGFPVFNRSRSTEPHTHEKGTANTHGGDWDNGYFWNHFIDQYNGLAGLGKDADERRKVVKGENWDTIKSIKKEQKDNKKADRNWQHGVRSSNREFSINFNVTIMFKYNTVDNGWYFNSAMIFITFGFEFRKEARLSVCPIIYIYISTGISAEFAGGVVNEREVIEDENNTWDPTSKDWPIKDPDKGWFIANDSNATGGEYLSGKKGASFTRTVNSDAFNLYFRGTVSVALQQPDGKFKALGYVRSAGGDPVTVMLDDKVDGTAGGQHTVKITAMEHKKKDNETVSDAAKQRAVIDKIVPIQTIRNDTYFSGLSVTPTLFLELGAGIGIAIAKAEIYLKGLASCTFSFATRQNNAATKDTQLRDPSSSSVNVMGMNMPVVSSNEVAAMGSDDKVKAFSFDSFKFRVGLGVRVVLLMFSFEMDMVQFGIDYDKGKRQLTENGQIETPDHKSEEGFHNNGWRFAFLFLNENEKFNKAFALSDQEENYPGVRVTIPVNTFTAQEILGPEQGNKLMEEIDSLAFDPENLKDKAFQISGYSSSGDAFRLADGLVSGTDYQLLTVGTSNYLLYTVRDPEAGNQLVLSRIKNTGESVGLVNPVDENNTETPYIPVDNDIYDDLEFNASVNGDQIQVSWVSRVDKTAAPGEASQTKVPSNDRPYNENNKVYMDKENYSDTNLFPIPEAPVGAPEEQLPDSAPADPGPKPEEPKMPQGERPAAATKQSDYYMTEAEYQKLPEEAQAGYTKDEKTSEYYANAYESCDAAKAAFASDTQIWEAWEKYDADLAAYPAQLQKWTKADQAYKAYQDLKKEWDAYHDSTEYKDYLKYKADYEAWTKYYTDDAQAAKDGREAVADARKTRVKTASFNVNGGKTFTKPQVLAEEDGAYKFLPRVSPDGNLTFFARSNNFTPAEKTKADLKADDVYNVTKGEVTTDADGWTEGEGNPGAGFIRAYTKSNNDIYGKNTQFYFAYQTNGGVKLTGFTPKGWEPDAGSGNSGTRLTGMDMVMVDDSTFYLSFITNHTITTVDSTAGTSEERSVYKLYLQKGTVDPTTGEVTLEKAKMLRTLVDVGNGTDEVLTSNQENMVDGIYQNTGSGLTLVKQVADPFFGKISFMKGQLGALKGNPEDFGEDQEFEKANAAALSGTASEIFLLFEMNGSAYVIPRESLDNIVAGKSGMIIPFFTPGENDEHLGRASMSIGADGDGNITAVYTDMVPNTTNNAIFVSKWDPTTMTFGEGRMLAMNQMQTYEDSVAKNLDPDETEKAYYAKRTTDGDPIPSFAFHDLAVGLGLKKDDQLGESESTIVDRSTMVILARGTQTLLEEKPYPGEPDVKIVVPQYDENGQMATQTGYYALSFGVGEKNIGEGRILFENPIFVPGCQLIPMISFTNTGDIPIRGSKDNPITVELWISDQKAKGPGKLLKTWQIKENIPVGAKVTTEVPADDSNELRAQALPEALGGRKFYFTVKEDDTYIKEGAMQYNSLTAKGGTTRLIEDKADLNVENLEFTTRAIHGDTVELGVKLDVTNRGSQPAAAPFLQFRYQNGTNFDKLPADANLPEDTPLEPTYTTLDLTGNTLKTSEQITITEIGQLAAEQDSLQTGIFRLIGTDGHDLKPGYKRTVEGSIIVPKDVYCQKTITGSLNLEITVMDQAATVTSLGADGTVVSTFDTERSGDDNTGYGTVEPTTFFQAPSRIALPLGATLRLSLPVETTEKTAPIITTSDMNLLDAAADNLGILYYDMGASKTGKDGYLVITPSKEGSGIIRVADEKTNAFKDIGYTVTAPGQGVNIFRNNDRFTWYNSNGTKVDPMDSTSVTGWDFMENAQIWGQGSNEETPYLSDLSTARKNVSFSFDTLAESVDVYFNGTITVNGQKYTAAGGKDGFKKIKLGENPLNETRHVVIKAGAGTSLDRMVEHFAGNQPILPDAGGVAPQIYLNRFTLPNTASLNSGETQEIEVWVLDETGVASAVLESNSKNIKIMEGSSKTISDNLRRFVVNVAENGEFTIKASDVAGNTSTRTIKVDWFAPTAPANPDNGITVDKTWSYSREGIKDTDQLGKDDQAFITPVVKDKDGKPVTDAETTLEFYEVISETVRTEYRLDTIPAPEEGGEVSYELVKVVTRYDASNRPIGEPQTTKTPAKDNTKVPADTTNVEISAEWKTVNLTDGKYSIDQNAVYKLIARSGKRDAVHLFRMDRLNTERPVLSLQRVEAEGGYALAYRAEKGKDGPAKLTRVELVDAQGKALWVLRSETEAAPMLDGMIPLTYGGTYRLRVIDEAGNSTISQMTINMPVQALGAITAKPVRNNDRNDGSITVDLSKLTGGSYDAVTDQGVFSNNYQLAMVPADKNFDGKDEEFLTWAEGLKWQKTNSFTGLTPGIYYLYIKDDNDELTKADCYISTGLTVNNHAVFFTAATDFNSILVSPTGAEIFDIVAIKAPKQTKPSKENPEPAPILWPMEEVEKQAANLLKEAIPKAEKAKEDALKQQKAALDFANEELATATDSFPKGKSFEQAETYVKALRAVDQAELDAAEAEKLLTQAQKDLQAKQDALKGASDADKPAAQAEVDKAQQLVTTAEQNLAKVNETLAAARTNLAAAEKGLTDKEKEAFLNYVVAKENAVQCATNYARTQKTTTEDWMDPDGVYGWSDRTAYTGLPGGIYQVVVRDKQDTNRYYMELIEVKKRLFVPDTKPCPGELSEEEELYYSTNNQHKDLTILQNGAVTVIPKGSMAAGGDAISDRLLKIPEGFGKVDADTVVLYTAPDGTKNILPYCTNKDGLVYYLADKPGKYELTRNPKDFVDVNGHWAEFYMNFAAVRELFNGVEEKRFAPDLTMSRAMFVTVLARMESIDIKDYTGTHFDDVAVDAWYAPYVEWARQNDVVRGYGNGEFGPDDPVTREQMAVILKNYTAPEEVTVNGLESLDRYSDRDQISGWAETACAWATEKGMLHGTDDGRFLPGSNASRGEVATFLTQYIVITVTDLKEDALTINLRF